MHHKIKSNVNSQVEEDSFAAFSSHLYSIILHFYSMRTDFYEKQGADWYYVLKEKQYVLLLQSYMLQYEAL